MRQTPEQARDLAIAAAFHGVGQFAEPRRRLAFEMNRIGQKFFNRLHCHTLQFFTKDRGGGEAAAARADQTACDLVSHSSRAIQASSTFTWSASSLTNSFAMATTSGSFEVPATA